MSVRPIPRWLPNAISVMRVFLVPAWVLCAEVAHRAGEVGDDPSRWQIWATAVLLTIGGSDAFDGWLARRFDLQSHFGETLDAVADKLAQVVLFTYLALRTGPAFAAVPLWFLALLITRDVLLLFGYVAIRRKCGEVNAEHRLHGKASSCLLFLLLVAFSAGAPKSLLTSTLIASTLLFTASTALYVRHGVRQYWQLPA